MRVLLVVYDNGAYMHNFPMGLGYISRVLEDMGHEVHVYSQDMHHYPDDHLRTFLDENPFDVVCISLIAGYYQYRRLKDWQSPGYVCDQNRFWVPACP